MGEPQMVGWLRPKHGRTWHRIVGHTVRVGRLYPVLACGGDTTDKWRPVALPEGQQPAGHGLCRGCTEEVHTDG